MLLDGFLYKNHCISNGKPYIFNFRLPIWWPENAPWRLPRDAFLITRLQRNSLRPFWFLIFGRKTLHFGFSKPRWIFCPWRVRRETINPMVWRTTRSRPSIWDYKNQWNLHTSFFQSLPLSTFAIKTNVKHSLLKTRGFCLTLGDAFFCFCNLKQKQKQCFFNYVHLVVPSAYSQMIRFCL